jgi:peptide/nickel transport system permease protein
MSQPANYSELIVQRFTRSKLTLLAVGFAVLTALVAVLCPLLANNRPLVMYASMQGLFENHLAVALEQADLFRRSGEEDARALALSHLTELEEHLPAAHHGVLERTIEALRRGPLGGEAIADLEALGSAQPERILRFPLLRGLEVGELFVILGGAAGLVLCLLRRTRWIPAACVLALLFSLACRTIFPPTRDTLNYRRVLQSDTFRSEKGWAILPPVFFGENENIISDARKSPSWIGSTEARHWHWFGTDTNGRDVLVRLIYGARVSMLVGIVSVALYTLIGVVLGALAGYYRGWVDLLISRTIELIICFPVLMVILSVQAFLAPSLINLILAMTLLWWTSVARLMRAEFLRLTELDFVSGVRALGGSDLRIIFLHILPNGLGPVLVMISFGVAGSIVVESALSYLGFGVPQPMASWGDLLNNGRNDVAGLWWLTVFPGLAIFLTVTCFNLVGEAVRDALDPKG